MKLFLVLAFVGPALSALFGDKPVCPPRLSLSILKHSTAKTDCDLCDYYFDNKGEYYWWCFPDHGIDEKMLADCKRMKELGKDELIRWFYGLDSRYSKCDPPICDCDSCSELAKPTRSFMKVCAPNMTQDVVAEKLGTCNQVYQDREKLWIFFDDLKTECYSLTGENITLPICECDVCWMLLYETSDFMTKCGNQMNREMLKKLLSTCEKIMCDPIELGYFKMNLELICKQKMNVTFEFPQCACEECWLLFQTNSDFMKKCGSGISQKLLMELMKDCYTNMDSLDRFMTFLANLESICYDKGNEYFKYEWCYCTECLLLEDHTENIWKDCVRHMPNSVRRNFREDCLRAKNQTQNSGNFTTDIIQYCYCHQGLNVTIPNCGRCSKDDLCTLFVVDTSPSILDHGYLAALRGVSDGFYTLIEDSLGENKSHYGKIGFDQYPTRLFPIGIGYMTNWVFYLLDRLQLYYNYKIGTEIPSALNLVRNDISTCDRGRPRSKYVIILTDAYNTFLTRDKIKPAVDKIPEDVIIISVGVGYFDPHYLLLIARNKPENVYHLNGPSDVSMVLGDLRRNIGC